MKTRIYSLFLGLAFLAGVHQVFAQGTGFFRISGPAASGIIAFNADGTMIWTNALPSTNYTIQTLSSLPGGTHWVDYVQLPVTNRINTNLLISFHPPAGMALIPAGTFTMGDTLDGESDAIPTNIYVSAFYMDVNLVSWSQWQTVNSYATNHGYHFFTNTTYAVYQADGKAANHPVQTVDWFDCVKWSNARSMQAGLTPVYYTDAGFTHIYTNGEVAPYMNLAANGYRLPTEAEWEKAARGGLSGQRFPWGDTISWSQANYYGYPGSLGGYAYDLATAIDYDPAFSGGDSGNYPYTSPVNYFAPNGYGLYDMAGNVWQWCWGWYWSYGSAAQTDPHGLTSGSTVVCRGGDHEDNAPFCRTAHREQASLSYADAYLGFRTVLPLGQ